MVHSDRRNQATVESIEELFRKSKREANRFASTAVGLLVIIFLVCQLTDWFAAPNWARRDLKNYTATTELAKRPPKLMEVNEDASEISQHPELPIEAPPIEEPELEEFEPTDWNWDEWVHSDEDVSSVRDEESENAPENTSDEVAAIEETDSISGEVEGLDLSWLSRLAKNERAWNKDEALDRTQIVISIESRYSKAVFDVTKTFDDPENRTELDHLIDDYRDYVRRIFVDELDDLGKFPFLYKLEIVIGKQAQVKGSD